MNNHLLYSNPIRWIIISLYFVAAMCCATWYAPKVEAILPMICAFSIFIAVSLHGIARYGSKNFLVFFIISWLLIHFSQVLSIYTGFPFGNYFYDKLFGPQIFEVPLSISLMYFGIAYASWILSTILLQQFANQLRGKQRFFVPLISSFIMVMWLLSMDPIASTIHSLWIWKDGGEYFGVPVQSFFGWFIIFFIIYQIFAFYIASNDRVINQSSSAFWFEALAIYGIQAIVQLVSPFAASRQIEIYNVMALETFFTMVFVLILSAIAISNVKSSPTAKRLK